MSRVSILGATGSIGQNTLDLIKRDLDRYDVVALTGGRNIAQLAQDARDVRAQIAVTAYDADLPALRDALAGTGIEVAAGRAALIEAGARPADWVMSAIVGAAGLEPGLSAIEQGATLALANKETLVTAGEMVMSACAQHGATLLPVDSEHSAIFQAIQGEDPAAIERVQVTASGGAFRDWPVADLAKATPEQAATHPTWDMGQRITIDSASMFNKALELIETREYFGLNPDQIEAVIHPESLVHAVVSFVDGGMLAHLGEHDMRHAIGFALHWPNRQHLPVGRLDLTRIGALHFVAPDPARHQPLELARRVMALRGAAGAVFNGAKERALDLFIAREIGFLDMARVVEQTLDRTEASGDLAVDHLSLDCVLHADALARRLVDEIAPTL